MEIISALPCYFTLAEPAKVVPDAATGIELIVADVSVTACHKQSPEKHRQLKSAYCIGIVIGCSRQPPSRYDRSGSESALLVDVQHDRSCFVSGRHRNIL